MPPGFEPIPFRPPLWLEGGDEIAVSGVQAGRTIVAGFDGSLQHRRILAADGGPPVPDGALMDFAASPDGLAVVSAVNEPAAKHLDVVLRTLSAADEGKRIASFDQPFESVSLAWPESQTIALGVGALQPSAPEAPGPASAPAKSDLYLIAAGNGSTEQVSLNCRLTRLSWSPDGAYAVGEGGGDAPVVIVDRRERACHPVNVPAPIRVLDWAPKRNAFLYAGAIPGSTITGVFEYDIASGESSPVAISSSGAVYNRDGAIVALGNAQLSLPRVLEHSAISTTAELALIRPARGQTRVMPLGVSTLASMLASSTMVRSPGFDSIAIDLFASGAMGPMQNIIAYSLASGTEILVAAGPARGLVLMSWSADGKTLAIFDGDSHRSTLTLVTPFSGARLPAGAKIKPPALPAITRP